MSERGGYHVEVFDGGKHNRKAFSCGVDSLDTYLQRFARQDRDRNFTALHVLVADDDVNVLGYYTLSSHHVEMTDLDETTTSRLPRYPHVPTTLLGRLAIDTSLQGSGWGQFLLMDALRRALEAGTEVGSWAVIVDAVDERARAFYERFEFLPFQDRPLTLYLEMAVIAALGL